MKKSEKKEQSFHADRPRKVVLKKQQEQQLKGNPVDASVDSKVVFVQ